MVLWSPSFIPEKNGYVFLFLFLVKEWYVKEAVVIKFCVVRMVVWQEQ